MALQKVNMLRQRGLVPIAITITGGDVVNFEGGGWRVEYRLEQHLEQLGDQSPPTPIERRRSSRSNRLCLAYRQARSPPTP
jgi:hypothetical protein